MAWMCFSTSIEVTRSPGSAGVSPAASECNDARMRGEEIASFTANHLAYIRGEMIRFIFSVFPDTVVCLARARKQQARRPRSQALRVAMFVVATGMTLSLLPSVATAPIQFRRWDQAHLPQG